VKLHFGGSMNWRVFGISLVVALACACATIPLASGVEYDPPNGKGPIVILLSGYDGPDNYKSYATEVARLGYYAILLDGKEYYKYGKSALKDAIERAQRSPKAIPGKAPVIGFSMGGGAAINDATFMPDYVSAVVAYYPMTKELGNMRKLAAKFKVPTLVFAGGKDTYNNCCLIESMREMEAGAKESGVTFELVVYPDAKHVFNIPEAKQVYRAEDAADAWQRTTKMLSQYQPLP